ncbi:MAG: ABC transporter permease, partial [Lachnospiraceae bacterium]|nr:ABC transporter permease [Lachnospiraceae bacterium]
MLSYILKRIFSLIPTVFVVSIVIFLVVYMVPGGPATALLGMEATPEAIAELNAELGFDRPFLVQYADWLVNVLHGDWGQSYFLQTSVLDAIAEYFRPTLSLAILAQLISVLISIPRGIIAAYKRGTL